MNFRDSHFAETDDLPVDWSYLFSPSDWYVNMEMIQDNFLALVASFAVVAVCSVLFVVIRKLGSNTEWYKSLRFANRLRLSDDQVTIIWILLYIPLAFSAWLIWVYGGEEWNRGLTIYSLHLIVNVLFAVSFWWVQDISLALLNLITLIGVAMFTTSQFNYTLKFASYINTPYLLFLFIYTVQFSYFWYLNEGKELMNITKQLQSGQSLTQVLSAPEKVNDPEVKRRERVNRLIPKDVQEKLKEKVKQARTKVDSNPTSDVEPTTPEKVEEPVTVPEPVKKESTLQKRPAVNVKPAKKK